MTILFDTYLFWLGDLKILAETWAIIILEAKYLISFLQMCLNCMLHMCTCFQFFRSLFTVRFMVIYKAIVCRNLASNNFNGAIPYSISQMVSLKYLWVTFFCSFLDTDFPYIQPKQFLFLFFLFGSVETSVTIRFRTSWMTCLDNFPLFPHCELLSPMYLITK